MNDNKTWLKENQQGLGDKIDYALNETKVSKLTKIVKKNIFHDGEDCGCDERRKKLNKVFPKPIQPVRCLTQDEYDRYSVVKRLSYRIISKEGEEFICKLYASVFDKLYFKPCPTCDKKPIKIMMEKLDQLFNSY